jgi:hypothetical protein
LPFSDLVCRGLKLGESHRAVWAEFDAPAFLFGHGEDVAELGMDRSRGGNEDKQLVATNDTPPIPLYVGTHRGELSFGSRGKHALLRA